MHALQAGRPYRGVSPADRIALRRARLVTSAVALFGTLGYPATSIKGVCMHAGLTERSFYESFGAKEDLLQTATAIAPAAFTRSSPPPPNRPSRRLRHACSQPSVPTSPRSANRPWRELRGTPKDALSAELLASAVLGASGYGRPQDDVVRNCHAVFLGTIGHWGPAPARQVARPNHPNRS